MAGERVEVEAEGEAEAEVREGKGELRREGFPILNDKLLPVVGKVTHTSEMPSQNSKGRETNDKKSGKKILNLMKAGS